MYGISFVIIVLIIAVLALVVIMNRDSLGRFFADMQA